MGYTLVPIAIELDQLTAALGSGDKRLLSSVARKYRDEFEQIDDMAAEFFEDEHLDGALTVRDALRQMVNGEAYRRERGLGFVYGYALHFLCLHLGEELPNGWWRTTSGWPVKQHADRALAAAGVAEGVLRTRMLVERGPPVPLPEVEDYPSVGYLRVSEARVALSALPEAAVAAVGDPDIRGAIGVLRGWLSTCVGSERDLICFEA